MHAQLIDYETLQYHVGGSTPAEVCARLRSAGVPFLLGKRGRPFTTLLALNQAMGVTSWETNPTSGLGEVEIL